jgi:hypothetical protein
MKTPGYLDQVDRIKIGCNLFYDAVRDKLPINTLDYYFYSFCVVCYQLKDWLTNDTTLPQVFRDDVQNHINRNKRLGNLGAIANTYKHLKLTRKYWQNITVTRDSKRKFSQLGVGPVFTVSDISTSSNITINTPYKCLFSWNKLFKKHQLPEPF